MPRANRTDFIQPRRRSRGLRPLVILAAVVSTGAAVLVTPVLATGASASFDPAVKPGPNTTGPTTPGSLTPISGLTISTPGTVLEGVFVTGTIKVKASNVTIRNFRLNANGSPYGINATFGARGLVIEAGEMYGAASALIYGGNFTARQLNLHDSGSDAFKPTTEVVAEYNWFHHLGVNVGSHADGVQTSWGGTNISYRYNNCDMPTGLAGYHSNSCFFIQDTNGFIIINIESNWLNGGNWTIYCPAQGVTLVNNKFGRDYQYGLISGSCGKGTGNVWEDTGAPI